MSLDHYAFYYSMYFARLRCQLVFIRIYGYGLFATTLTLKLRHSDVIVV